MTSNSKLSPKQKIKSNQQPDLKVEFLDALIAYDKKKQLEKESKFKGNVSSLSNISDTKNEPMVNFDTPSIQENEDTTTQTEAKFQGLENTLHFKRPNIRKSWFLTTLLIVQLGLVCAVLWEVLNWIVKYRGGLHLDSWFEQPKRHEILNRHTLLCTISTAVLFPMSFVLLMFFQPNNIDSGGVKEQKPKKCVYKKRVVLDSVIKLTSIAILVLGLIELYYYDNVEDDRFPFRVDLGIHCVTGWILVIIFAMYLTLILMKRKSYYLPSRLSHSTMTEESTLENVRFIVNLLCILAAITGLTAYHDLVNKSDVYDEIHLYKVAINEATSAEHEVFKRLFTLLVLVFCFDIIISFVVHQIVYHADLIPYHHYHDREKFLQIVQKVRHMEEDEQKNVESIA